MEPVRQGIELILTNKDHDFWEKRSEGLTILKVAISFALGIRVELVCFVRLQEFFQASNKDTFSSPKFPSKELKDALEFTVGGTLFHTNC